MGNVPALERKACMNLLSYTELVNLIKVLIVPGTSRLIIYWQVPFTKVPGNRVHIEIGIKRPCLGQKVEVQGHA